MSSIMQQFRQWRRNVPAEWQRPEATEQIGPRFVETALRTAWKNGAKHREGIEGAIVDVRRFLQAMGEPAHRPPAAARRMAMHRQQLADDWTALDAAFTAASLKRIAMQSTRMMFDIVHLQIEMGAPTAQIWQHLRDAFARKDPAQKEVDGRIKWPAGILNELAEIIDTANSNPDAE
jgi:hypothetical protein